MELDDLKKTWIALDNVSKENKKLKETLIIKMIERNADSSTSKLLRWDVFNFIISILVLFFCTFIYHYYGGRFLIWNITIVFAAIVCAISSIWYVYKINQLMKVNFSKKVSENIYRINRYNILVKKEKIISCLIIFPVFVILTAFVLFYTKTNTQSWIICVVLFFVAFIMTYWSYKRIYHKNIDDILRSLDEIKELNNGDLVDDEA